MANKPYLILLNYFIEWVDIKCRLLIKKRIEKIFKKVIIIKIRNIISKKLVAIQKKYVNFHNWIFVYIDKYLKIHLPRTHTILNSYRF